MISDDLATAHALADAARPIAMRYFRSTGLAVDGKQAAGALDPVTAADREIELAMRTLLAQRCPDDGIEGEEHDDTPGTSGRKWVLDPIDGTRAFICGLPSWGVLIALNNGEKPIIGIMDQPFTGERFEGDCNSARLLHHGNVQPLKTRQGVRLADALACGTAPDMFKQDDRAGLETIANAASLFRYGTDCYGYTMLAAGHIDLVLEASLKSVDIQALIPIVEGAGGIVTDWQGGDPQNGGRVLACGSRSLHKEALELLNQ